GDEARRRSRGADAPGCDDQTAGRSGRVLRPRRRRRTARPLSDRAARPAGLRRAPRRRQRRTPPGPAVSAARGSVDAPEPAGRRGHVLSPRGRGQSCGRRAAGARRGRAVPCGRRRHRARDDHERARQRPGQSRRALRRAPPDSRPPPGSAQKTTVLPSLGQPTVAVMLALGFSSGLPFFLSGNTLGYWLRDEGTTLQAIGFLSWVGLAYSLKFLWAPAVDRLDAPLFARFGRRRSWMLLTQ